MTAKNSSIIAIRDLYFSRGAQAIFSDLSIDIERHKVTAIMGPSGTGKTTLLNLIGGQLQPQSGSVLVDGEEVTSLSRKSLYRLRRKMGVLFQGGALFTDLNVYENVAFSLREHTRLPEDMIRDLVLMMLEAVGLRGAAALPISQLSGGMARRVALARSVILGPEIMMYDEPFVGQDPISRGVLITLIKQMNEALNLTSVIVSHDVHETAAIADYVYIISKGRVIGEGTPDALMQDRSPLVKQFVEGSPDGPITFHYPANNFRKELYL
ncbi:MAG: ATP-binding cassette domain-containing protein [Coxiellaceae bacterium]|nr:ATP-binding cassette domain-containing protein [Coxiellaceae bacterium]